MKQVDLFECCFNSHIPVASMVVRSTSVESAIEQCKLVLGERTVRESLTSVTLKLPF